MKKNIQKITLIILTMVLPIISSAQTLGQDIQMDKISGRLCNNNFETIGDILGWATCMLSNSIVPFLFSLALAFFIWGVIKFTMADVDSKEKQKGKDFMIYGIVALFVMVSVWGLVNVLNLTFGVRNVIPQLPTTSN